MKKLFFTLMLAVVAMAGMAQTIGEAFYIFRNDGQVNVFVRDEIESMEYSYEDSEGNHYDEIVTQIVNTADSIYKIPLAVIDSIGFVTPETKYQPGVVVIEGELRQYVESVDKMKITFSSQIPNTLLPSVGDKLVTLEQSDIFPYGFLGEVASVIKTSEGNHIVSCDAANMTDVFKCYYGVADYSVDTSGSRLRRAQYQGEGVFTPGPFQHELTDELTRTIHLDDRFAFSYNSNFSVSVSPTLRVRGYMIVPDHEDHELYISLSCYGDFHLTEHIGATGTLRWNRDFGWIDPATHLPRLSWPIPRCPLIRFYIEPGVFVRAASKISSQLEFNQDYRLVFHYDVSATTGQSMQPRFKWIPVDASTSGVVTMNGSVAVGGYAEMGFLIQDKRFAHLCFRGEIGVEGESNAVLLQDDVETAASSTAVYEQLHNTAFNINWFRGSKLEGRIWPFSVSHNLPLSSRGKIASLGHVPDFSNVSLTADGEGALKAEAEVRGNIMRPVRVGFTLQDENENTVETYFAQTEYQSTPSLLRHTFSDLEVGKKYTVYPVVELLDIYMLASPSATSEAKGFPVTLSDFKVTNKQHKENGFTHNGQSYDYCFNVSITATLDNDAENIAEWGYVYLDPNGKEAFIPLSGHSYTDTRYAYYRNGTPPFTCTLYGYVKYVGNGETIYGEPHDYPLEYGETSCPDHNHPHAIDLGLPSGTKWACCNVGATAPEGYGNYYAWGETQPKSDYDWYTYPYGSSWDNVVNIGSDIAGTSYDAATANWGAPWRMPSLDQIQELLNYTTSEWTTENGVYGYKFTGRNGGTVFLPAAGYFEYTEHNQAGVAGGYWLSALCESYPYRACLLTFDYRDVWYTNSYEYGAHRYMGESVRPVR